VPTRSWMQSSRSLMMPSKALYKTEENLR
jgi:hypothetical protein